MITGKSKKIKKNTSIPYDDDNVIGSKCPCSAKQCKGKTTKYFAPGIWAQFKKGKIVNASKGYVDKYMKKKKVKYGNS